MSAKRNLFLILIFFFCIQVYSQTIVRKKITAIRIDVPIKIDGILDEQGYQDTDTAKDFVQMMPYNGKPSYQPTEVKILYDDKAIYIGAMLYDNPDSIHSYITTRDNIGVSDYFDVFIDPNNEGLTGYEFLVTPANSQTDLKAIKQSDSDSEDSGWDAVWQSATLITPEGWVAEIRIPYSALRFPQKENPVWGINFFRRIRRYNSNNSWNLINSEISGFIQQSGELYGLKDIKAPVRLSVTPYVAAYIEHQAGNSKPDCLFKGGVDVKYGISESHTLDMMLIPDFGQIQSDDKDLNLTPYEIYYDEKRQFFVEGVELFNRADIFYSRRIGGTPKFNKIDDSKLNTTEKVTFNPTETQLVNATKISGRGKKGWGVGFLNAMSLPGKAVITDTLTGATRKLVTQPFTNYNVSMVEKAIKNNSYISLINTNLSMSGNPYMANVTGTEFQLKDKKQKFQLSGSGTVSYRSEADKKTGYGYSLALKKIKGKFGFLLDHDVKNDSFDPNDLGYLQRNNEISDDAQISYTIHDPFWIFKSWYIQARTENTMLFSPKKEIENQLKLWTDAQFRNNWWLGFFYVYCFGTHDYYETRVENRYYVGPRYHMYELDFQTDSDKKLSWFFVGGEYLCTDTNTHGFWCNTNLWWKASQRFNFYYEVSTNQDFDNFGYVDDHGRDSVYFGHFNRHTLVNTLTMSYTFNTRLKIDFRGRHYWSWADYNTYYFLNPDGSLAYTSAYTENADVNYNAFNIDMTLKWEFAPGSEMSLVWKNAIYTEDKNMNMKFGTNFVNTLKSDQTNSISVKILYYLDYNMLMAKKDRHESRFN